jgi:hypothetical protein
MSYSLALKNGARMGAMETQHNVEYSTKQPKPTTACEVNKLVATTARQQHEQQQLSNNNECIHDRNK